MNYYICRLNILIHQFFYNINDFIFIRGSSVGYDSEFLF